MKKQAALFLFFSFIMVPGMALWKTEGATAEKLSIPSNTWVRVKTTGDGSASQYGTQGLPRFRGWHQASFDLDTREVVIFGGSSSTYMSDTWTFNLNERVWHIRRPHPDLSGPCRRDNHNLVYDPVGKVHWLFNGIAYPDQQPDCSRGATWIYDRSKNEWTKVAVSGDRNHRLAPGIAYNPDRREFLQFGGGAVNLSDTTVRFHIAERRWQLVRTNPSPPHRTNIEGGLVYDRAHKLFVLFGGKGSKGVLNDTWTFDPNAGKWERKNPSVSPPARDVHAMVYDEAHEKLILFGGRGGGGRKLNDTWIYDTSKGEWSELKTTGNPPPLIHHSGVYDSFNDVVIIVDGNETIVFRYAPSSGSTTSSNAKVGRDSHADSQYKLPPGKTKKQHAGFSGQEFKNTKILAIAAKSDANEIQQREIVDAGHQTPKKFLDIPPRTWIARALPGRGKGPWSPMKHIRLAFNPVNQRGYVLGGDYSGPIGMQSGRNEVYSYSMAGNDWRLEHPYCGSEGSVQPSHPDEVGWVYDTKRNIFWMLPGYMGGDQGVCPESKLIRGQIMTFDPETRKWDWPKRKNSGGSAGNKKFAQYDAKKDQIVRFSWTGSVASEVYDIQKDVWSIKRQGGQAYQIGQEYTAMDEESRQIYVIAPKESRLFVYDMDRYSFRDLGEIPARALNDHTIPVWDSVNHVLLWPQVVNRAGIITLFVYDPTSKQWEKMPMNQPEGLTVTGADALFDPIHNVLMVMGGTGKPENQRVFLYRYGSGRR